MSKIFKTLFLLGSFFIPLFVLAGSFESVDYSGFIPNTYVRGTFFVKITETIGEGSYRLRITPPQEAFDSFKNASFYYLKLHLPQGVSPPQEFSSSQKIVKTTEVETGIQRFYITFNLKGGDLSGIGLELALKNIFMDNYKDFEGEYSFELWPIEGEGSKSVGSLDFETEFGQWVWRFEQGQWVFKYIEEPKPYHIYCCCSPCKLPPYEEVADLWDRGEMIMGCVIKGDQGIDSKADCEKMKGQWYTIRWDEAYKSIFPLSQEGAFADYNCYDMFDWEERCFDPSIQPESLADLWLKKRELDELRKKQEILKKYQKELASRIPSPSTLLSQIEEKYKKSEGDLKEAFHKFKTEGAPREGLLAGLSCIKKGDCDICDFIALGINFVRLLLGIAGGLALLFFIIGGMIFLTSRGNPEKIEKGKRMLTGTLIGLIIMLMAWTVINVALGIIFRPPGIEGEGFKFRGKLLTENWAKVCEEWKGGK